MILTSMLKNVGDSFVAFFEDVENGEEVWGKLNRLGLKEKSVGYVDNEFFQQNVPRRSVTRWLNPRRRSFPARSL